MKVKLLDFKELKGFPSGSGIEYFNEHLYLVGDDATHVLVLNKRWKQEKKIPLFESDTDRIAKQRKSDLEATTIISVNKSPRLLMMGSGSRGPFRNKACLLDLDTLQMEEFDLHVFYERLAQTSLSGLNIEGAAVIEDNVVLCNRGHKAQPSNCIVVTGTRFWKEQDTAPQTILKMDFEDVPDKLMGVSGLCYSEKNDWLLFTASTELTENAVDNGPIGDSYLGIIENASRKIGRKKMKVNSIVNLATTHEKFKGRKIESACIQRDRENNLRLHLVADDDKGGTVLFKVRVKYS